ncbi:hypothetical protein Tco_1414076 [Tanacetum coccineum]
MRRERKVVRGEESSVVQDIYYEFEDISATDSDATEDSSCSYTNEENKDETDNAEDYDMDTSDDEHNKEDDDTAGFGYLSITILRNYPILHPSVPQSLVANPKGNPEEMFVDNVDHQKLETLSSINVPEAIEEAVQAKVLTQMKKQLPTHMPKSIATYVKPRLKTLCAKSYDDQYLPNDHEGERRKKRRKDAGECSSRSSRKRKLTWSVEAAMIKTIWFNMLLKSNIDQNEDHILRPSTVAIEKKLKELIQKDELTIADLEGAGLEKLKEHTGEKYVTSLRKHFAARYHIQDMGNRSLEKVYSDKRIIFVVRFIVKKKWRYGFLTLFLVRRSNKKEYQFSYAHLPRLSLNDIEDMYLLKVQDKLHHL